MQLHGSLANYLATQRKQAGLTQDDVIFLLQEKVERVAGYENGSVTPQVRSAIGLELIYNEPMQLLFAGIAEGVRTEIAARARILLQSMPEQVVAENAQTLETLGRIAKVDEQELTSWRDVA